MPVTTARRYRVSTTPPEYFAKKLPALARAADAGPGTTVHGRMANPGSVQVWRVDPLTHTVRPVRRRQSARPIV